MVIETLTDHTVFYMITVTDAPLCNQYIIYLKKQLTHLGYLNSSPVVNWGSYGLWYLMPISTIFQVYRGSSCSSIFSFLCIVL